MFAQGGRIVRSTRTNTSVLRRSHITCVLCFICSQQLEYLEDKLRELRFVSPDNTGDQKSILLGQLDSVRRELVETAHANADKVIYAKEILKEILSFALGDDEENSVYTPKVKSSRFSTGELTPKGNRTPAVPDSLEGNDGRRWIAKSPESSRRAKSAASTPATQWTDDELKSNQRKYSTFSRTLMVSDEDIYGPKETRRTTGNDSQGYGGTIKVKELLAKAEQGLTDVVTAQSERRSVPREHGGGVRMDVGSPIPWDDRVEEALLEDIPTTSTGIVATKTKYKAPWNAESRGLASISPDAKFGRGSRSKHLTPVQRRIDSRYPQNQGGIAVAIGKVASLAVLAGGIAAGVFAIAVAANNPGTSTVHAPVTKQKKKRKQKKTRPTYRGEADVYTVIEDNSDESNYFSDLTVQNEERGDQAPVMNVLRPPASENFPASPPDVTVAMG